MSEEMKETKEAINALSVAVNAIAQPLKDGFQAKDDLVAMSQNLMDGFKDILAGIQGSTQITQEFQNSTASKMLRLAGDSCYHVADLLEAKAAVVTPAV